MKTKILVVCALLLGAGSPRPAAAAEKQKVLGIGGFFFRTKNPDALKKWYLENLGINLPPRSFTDVPWTQEAGVTIFEAFPADTDLFDATKGWMINFRVKDLAAMVAQLEAAGVKDIKFDPKDEQPNGLFAHLKDPDGNPVELWEFRLPKTPVK